jgi:putative FmdB family regulatory protein
MPTYEYTCNKCDKEFEVFQSMKDEPLKVCTCGKKGKVTRKIGGGAGLIFKGSGFYITDYKKSSSSPSKSGDSEKSSSSGGGTEKKASSS